MEIMDSKNFEMLRACWPELAALGGFAENYAHTDASSTLIKLRTFCEQLVEGIYQTHDLQLPYQRNLFDLLAVEEFKSVVPKVVLDKLHLIRVNGNKAAHGQKLTMRIKLARKDFHVSCSGITQKLSNSSNSLSLLVQMGSKFFPQLANLINDFSITISTR